MTTDHAFVCVSWLDAHSGTDQWTQMTNLDQDGCLVKTAGFLLPEGKPHHVTIYQSRTPNDDIDHVLHIPTDMIQTIQTINLT